MIKWRMDINRIGVCYTMAWPSAIPAPWQHQVLQQHADTARTELLTKIPIHI